MRLAVLLALPLLLTGCATVREVNDYHRGLSSLNRGDVSATLQQIDLGTTVGDGPLIGALAAVEAGNPHLAREYLATASPRTRSEWYRYRVLSARTAYQLQDSAAAVRHLEALQREDYDLTAFDWNLLGWARYWLGDAQGARDGFQAAIDRQHAYEESWYGLGFAHLVQGEVDDARSAFTRCIAVAQDPFVRGRLIQEQTALLGYPALMTDQ